ncbi:MAG TPA: hypothetical protein VLL54_03305 [Pyrinomonadaceae bacterium]|nr:hypothetical protein [Pyrinomonadaceae bacterium]
MIRNTKLSSFLVAALALSLLSCFRQAKIQRVAQKTLPPIILWAWERPEDLEFLDAQRFGVAFLAQTLTLTADDVIFKPRHQPLKVSPATKLIAVTRIESQKKTGTKPGLTVAQRERLVTLINRTLELPNVSAVQIDFDAVLSEREFYRSLLEELRQKVPSDTPISMTALASFCIGDPWLTDLPVDEAVPMVFRMGADDKKIKSFLLADNDFVEPLCRNSYGIALDEPVTMKFKATRRLYVFADHSWTESDIALLEERLRQ